MIAWLTPGALAAFALLAAPVIVHLLARRNARRLVFPATAFVRATQAAAVRLRRPTDLVLLSVRLGVLALAVLAGAHPVVVTRWRQAAWNARVSRAVIIDSTSADAGAGRQLASQEAASAFRSVPIESADLADGIARAAQWLASAPPSRREIVVVSSFRMGALHPEALSLIPPGAGIRFLRVGTPRAEQTAALSPVTGWRGRRWQPTVTVSREGTRTSWQAVGGPDANGEPAKWLTVVSAPADVAAGDRARRAAVSFGVPSGDDRQKVVVSFAGAADAQGEPIHTPWIARAAEALRRSELLADVDVPVTARERDGTMIVGAPLSASSAAAPAVVRAAILAVRPAVLADQTLETMTISDAQLAQWRRDPAPVSADVVATLARGGQAEGETASRWLWAFALALLGVEGWLRRRTGRGALREAHADAA